MQLGRKGEYEISFSGDLEAEGNLALLLIHTLIGQPPEEYPVGGVVGVNGDADASRNVESIAIDADSLSQGEGDTSGADPGDQVGRLVAGQVGGDDDELIATEPGQGVGDTNGSPEIVGDMAEQRGASVTPVGRVAEPASVARCQSAG